MSANSDLAPRAADVILAAFNAYQDEFAAITRRAPGRFIRCDWHGVQADAVERLELYKKVKHLESQLEALGGDPTMVVGKSDGIPELPSLVSLVSPEESASVAPEPAPKSGVEYVELEGGA